MDNFPGFFYIGCMTDIAAQRVPGALSDVVVQDETGKDLRLGDVLGERPVVLLFLRHFG